MSLLPEYRPDEGEWICGRCHRPLTQMKVTVFYLNSAFDVVLPRCALCGFTLVPKTLALGKMHEVEALLEDK